MPAAFQSITSEALSTEVVADEAGWLALAPEWDSLLAHSGTRTPFQTFEWLDSWRKTLGAALPLFVVVVRGPERLCAAAPLCLHPDGVARFLGDPQNDYADILIGRDDDRALTALVAALRQHRGRYKRIELAQLPEHTSPWQRMVELADGAGLPARAQRIVECPMMSLADPEAARKLYYKKNIKNYVNYFKKHGDLTYSDFIYDGSLDVVLEGLFEQHVTRWSQTPYPSAFNNPVMRDFYRSFVSSMRSRQWVSLTGLALDDEFLALYLYFRYEGVVYMYKPTFNWEYRSHSPGQVILRYVLDNALDEKMDKLDYGRGNEGYKSRFTSELYFNRRVVLYKNTWERAKDNLVHQLKQSPFVRRLFEHRPLIWLRPRLG